MSWWWDNFWKPQQTKGKWCDFIFGFWLCSTAKNQNRPLEENELNSVDNPYRTYCNWFGIYRPQTQSWVYKTPTRHLPDTLQTPCRHPKIWHVLTNLRLLGGKEKANEDESNWMFIICLHILSPQAVPKVTQTTPRHLPDTLQTPQIRHIFTNPRQLGDKKLANLD